MKNKIDWTIHGVVEQYDDNPLLKGMINLHTHGLTKHGLTELSAIVPEGYSYTKVTSMINDIGELMVNSEKFDIGFDTVHYVDKPDGTIEYTFKLIPVKCFGEDSLRIILPDYNGRFFDGKTELDPPQCALLHTTLFEIEEENSK